MIIHYLGVKHDRFWGYACTEENCTGIQEFASYGLGYCYQTTGPEIYIFWGKTGNIHSGTFNIKKGMYNNRFVHKRRARVYEYKPSIPMPEMENKILECIEQQAVILKLKNESAY